MGAADALDGGLDCAIRCRTEPHRGLRRL